jgi:hypothetical protein
LWEENSLLRLRKPSVAARVGAALFMGAIGLAAGTAQAADLGPRHHAQGQYDAATATYGVVEGDELVVISG